MSEAQKSVVLLRGGIDSTTSLALAISADLTASQVATWETA
jgi:7-cyano-7-deazaguanine synthase in queuosine biosynthesis